jgi:acetoin utilization deacetylase AcuC-like enzyme
MSRGSFKAALMAAGGAIKAVKAVLEGEVKRSFALVRPPGHHATANEPLGFCLFNNVAVAARDAMATGGLSRILIVDFDVHHGNGTQDAFYAESGVLYFSVHQYPWYPGTGYFDEAGEGEGEGYTVNVPLPPGSSDAEYLRSFEEILVPVAERFQPELIIVSAGYDAHLADKLSMMRVSTAGYIRMVETLCNLADGLCDGKLAMVLEGGYALETLAELVRVSLEVLMGKTVESSLVGPSPEQHRPLVAEQVMDAVKEIHGLA